MSNNERGGDFELLTDKEVEAQYKISRATQKVWRWRKRNNAKCYNGFPFIKVGRLVRYRRTEIESWITAKNQM
jgi:predicted DNA-binding transcriptional regulator AlpA